jgi:hypothetical protein
MKHSSFFSWNKFDFVKAAVMAAGTAISTNLIEILQASKIPTIDQLKAAAIVGLTTGMVYLLKQLITNAQGQLGKKDTSAIEPAKQ